MVRTDGAAGVSVQATQLSPKADAAAAASASGPQPSRGISGRPQGPTLTLVSATVAPLFISWTTLSACPLCEAMRRCSERARTWTPSSWLMEHQADAAAAWRTTGRSWGGRGDHPGASGSCCWKQRPHLSPAAPSTATPLQQQLAREETRREDGKQPVRKEGKGCNMASKWSSDEEPPQTYTISTSKTPWWQ